MACEAAVAEVLRRVYGKSFSVPARTHDPDMLAFLPSGGFAPSTLVTVYIRELTPVALLAFDTGPKVVVSDPALARALRHTRLPADDPFVAYLRDHFATWRPPFVEAEAFLASFATAPGKITTLAEAMSKNERTS